LYRAYLLKEQLRAVFAAKGHRGRVLLCGWIAWARRSRLAEFVALARTIRRFQQLIWNTPQTLRVERKIRGHPHPYPGPDLTRYGNHSPEAFNAMAMLTRGGLKLELPGRK